jgi:AraC-like DNA-binding protein
MRNPSTEAVPANVTRTVWGYAALRLCAGTERLGSDVLPILKDIGLGISELKTPGSRIPFEAYQRLVLACVLATGREDLGLYINTHIPALGNTFIQNALVSSRSAKSAFSRFEELANIVDSSLKVGFELKGEVSAFVFEAPPEIWPEPTQYFREDLFITGVVQMGRLLLAPNDGYVGIEVQRDAPKDVAPWHEFFGDQITWGATESKVWWKTAAIHRVRPAHNEGVASANFELALQSRLNSSDLVRQVKALIRARLAEGNAVQKVIAEDIGLEVRTLQRSLKAEGTSFRGLLTGVRKEQALKCLSMGQPIGVISADLGYLDQSAFSAAFKGWFGVSPAEYRKSQSE